MPPSFGETPYQNPAWKNPTNHYRILHVQPDAPAEIIRSSYRTLMQQLKQHPDLGGEHWNATLINEAYAVLSDPERRAAYDEKLLAETSRSSHHAGAAREEEPPVKKPYPGGEYEPRLRYYCSFCKTPHTDSALTFPESTCIDCASPLFPAAVQRTGAADRRAVPRTPKQQTIRFFTAWPQRRGQTAETTDVSVNGLRFITESPVARDQYLKIESEVFAAVAQVTNCTVAGSTAGERWIVGARFVTLRFGSARGVFVSAEV